MFFNERPQHSSQDILSAINKNCFSYDGLPIINKILRGGGGSISSTNTLKFNFSTLEAAMLLYMV